jgi:hypothetical protein
MYFWRIEELKIKMAMRPLSDREVLPYFVLFLVPYTALPFFPTAELNLWDTLGTGLSVLLAVFGTLWIYHQNGGAQGIHFLQRYFAIGWVVGIRLLVGIIGILIPLLIIREVLGFQESVTTWYEFLFLAFAEITLYWRIGYHICDLANKAERV